MGSSFSRAARAVRERLTVAVAVANWKGPLAIDSHGFTVIQAGYRADAVADKHPDSATRPLQLWECGFAFCRALRLTP
jgi:hypothetical protein